MVDFVKIYLESHDPLSTQIKTKFPFRRRFEHCLRCAIWARRIAFSENADVEICVISALFHDVSKFEENKGKRHEEAGAQICNEYLSSIGYDKNKKEEIVRIVQHHSGHASERDASLESKVVSDADLLDETGAVAVLWDAMGCALGDSPSYDKAFERIRKDYTESKNMPPNLHTRTAKKLFGERLSLMESFLKNLEYELGRGDTL